MLGVFLKDTFLYAIGVFSIRLINFILMPFLTRKMSPAEYGIITLVLTTAPIILYVLTLQVSQAIPKYCANNPDDYNKKTYISTGFWYVLLSYIVFYGIASGFPYLGEMVLGIAGHPFLFHLALINICLFGLYTYLETQLRWDKKVLEYTLVSVIMTVSSLALIIGFFFFDQNLLEGYFIGSAIGQSIGCLLAYYYGRDNYHFVISKKILLQMLNFTFPLTIAAVGSYVFANLNQWLIRFFCDFNALGVYGVASRFSSVISLILGCISLGITPIIYAEYKKKEMPGFISFLFRACLLFALWCAAIFTVFHQEILTVVVGKDFYSAGVYIPLILLSYALAGLFIFTPGQWIANKTKELAAINIAAGITNLLVATLFIKLFSLQGAVISAFIASLLQLGLNIFFSNRHYYIDFKLIRITIAFILFFIFYLFAFNMYSMFLFMLASGFLLIKKDDLLTYCVRIHGQENTNEHETI